MQQCAKRPHTPAPGATATLLKEGEMSTLKKPDGACELAFLSCGSWPLR